MQWSNRCPLLIFFKKSFSGAGFDTKDAVLSKTEEGLAILGLLSTHYVPGTVLETLLRLLFNQYHTCFHSNPGLLNKRKSKNMLGVWRTVQGSRGEKGGGSCWAHREPGARLQEKGPTGRVRSFHWERPQGLLPAYPPLHTPFSSFTSEVQRFYDKRSQQKILDEF